MRRVGVRIAAIVSLSIALPLAVAAAQQGGAWVTSLNWPDGKEVQWRATPAAACDGSNVELRLNNASQSSGMARMTAATFACVKPGEYVGPERSLGVVSPGTQITAQTFNCACAEKGGVKALLSVDLEFLRDGAGTETLTNGCSYTGAYSAGQRNGRGVYTCADGYRYDGGWRAEPAERRRHGSHRQRPEI